MIAQSRRSQSRIMTRKLHHLCTAAALVGLSFSAHAANIVADSGFESAGGGNTYFAGQSIDGGSWTVTLGSVYVDSADPYVYRGNNSLNLTGVNTFVPDAISQTLLTVAGATYNLNFWANADSPNLFSITENGIAIAGTPTTIAQGNFNDPVSNSIDFTDYTASFISTSALTTLKLTATANPSLLLNNGAGSVVVDNISVQQAPVPEPGSILLTVTGALAGALLLWRKNNQLTFMSRA